MSHLQSSIATSKKLGLIIGSSRVGGNGEGIKPWLESILRERLSSSHPDYSIVVPDAHLNLGPITGRMPALIRDPAQHESPEVRAWSTFVTSCKAFIILTPQYNGGYPGELKNSIDHLYWEWHGRHVFLVTYGKRGGPRCAAQLASCLEHHLKMVICPERVEIVLPEGYITGDSRVEAKDFVEGADGGPEFLKKYREDVIKAFDMFLTTLTPLPAQ
jgi:NAD(P)H-dependent FMN reductase